MRSGAASTPGSGQGSGGFWCRYLVRFRRVPVQIPREVPEGSGEDTCWASGGFCAVLGGYWCRYLGWGSRRFWCRYLVEVPEVSAPVQLATWWGSGGSRWRCVVRFRRVPGQSTLWGSGRFRCRDLLRFRCRDLVRFRRVLAEKMLGEVPEGSGADTLWGSGGFWCRCCVKFQRVPMVFFYGRST